MSKNLRPWAFTCIWVAGQWSVMEELRIEKKQTFSISVIHTGSFPSNWMRRSEFKSRSYPRGAWSSWANPIGFALPNELTDRKNTKSFKFILVWEKNLVAQNGIINQYDYVHNVNWESAQTVTCFGCHTHILLMSKVASKAKAQIVVCLILSLMFHISQLVAFVDSSRQSCTNTPCGSSSWCPRSEIHGFL